MINSKGELTLEQAIAYAKAQMWRSPTDAVVMRILVDTLILARKVLDNAVPQSEPRHGHDYINLNVYAPAWQAWTEKEK